MSQNKYQNYNYNYNQQGNASSSSSSSSQSQQSQILQAAPQSNQQISPYNKQQQQKQLSYNLMMSSRYSAFCMLLEIQQLSSQSFLCSIGDQKKSYTCQILLRFLNKLEYDQNYYNYEDLQLLNTRIDMNQENINPLQFLQSLLYTINKEIDDNAKNSYILNDFNKFYFIQYTNQIKCWKCGNKTDLKIQEIQYIDFLRYDMLQENLIYDRCSCDQLLEKHTNILNSPLYILFAFTDNSSKQILNNKYFTINQQQYEIIGFCGLDQFNQNLFFERQNDNKWSYYSLNSEINSQLNFDIAQYCLLQRTSQSQFNNKDGEKVHKNLSYNDQHNNKHNNTYNKNDNKDSYNDKNSTYDKKYNNNSNSNNNNNNNNINNTFDKSYNNNDTFDKNSNNNALINIDNNNNISQNYNYKNNFNINNLKTQNNNYNNNISTSQTIDKPSNQTQFYQTRLEQDEWNQYSYKVGGIENQGMTCYINSALQMFRQMYKINPKFLSQHNKNTSLCLMNLFDKLESGNSDYKIYLKEIMKICKYYQTHSYQGGDSFQTVESLLSQILKEISQQKQEQNIKKSLQNLGESLNFFQKFYIIYFLDGLKCQDCEMYDFAHEEFFAFEEMVNCIDVSDFNDIQDTNSVYGDESLEQYCQTCNQYTIFKTERTIQYFPQFLIVRLTEANKNYYNKRYEKNQISNHNEIIFNCGMQKYEIVGYCSYYGIHYTYTAKEDAKEKNSKWFTYNDSTVTEVRPDFKNQKYYLLSRIDYK